MRKWLELDHMRNILTMIKMIKDNLIINVK